MRRNSTLVLVLLAVLTLAACSSGKPEPIASNATTVKLSAPSWETAKPYPSKTAKMICQPEARGEIAKRLGVTATRVVPAWNEQQHLYSCAYTYPHGRKIVLSVKETSNEQETTGYYDAVRKQYGTTQRLFGLGQGASLLRNDDIVVRKDYKVLLVDVKDLPTGTGTFAPALARSGVANSIVAVIMACWPGA